MTPKEYLQQYKNAVERAKAAFEHWEELDSIAKRATPNYGGEGGGQRQSGDEKMLNAVSKIIDAKNRVSDEMEMLEATEREIISTINKVSNPTLNTLLRKRYISCKTFEQIAVEMNYSWRQTIRLHGAALNSVRSILIKDGKI